MSASLSPQSRARVLFVSNVAWDHLWQRHQALACLFARDHDVVFCEIPGVRRVGWRDGRRIVRRLLQLAGGSADRGKLEPCPLGLCVLRPWVLPSTNGIFHAINYVLLNRFAQRHRSLLHEVDTIITYSAARAAIQLIGRVSHRWLVYDCTDNFSAVRGLPSCFLCDERRLLAMANLTLVPGLALAELHRSHAQRLEVLPHGADVERFIPTQERPKRPVDRPVTLVYYGHMHRQHFDFALVDALARKQPHWRFVLIGPVVTRWSFPANVELRGSQPHAHLRAFLEQADIIVLPYVINDYTRCVLPAKTFECLATGLPIVSTPLPELLRLTEGLIAFAADVDGFSSAVQYALETCGPGTASARIARGLQNSWEARYQTLRGWIGGNNSAVSS